VTRKLSIVFVPAFFVALGLIKSNFNPFSLALTPALISISSSRDNALNGLYLVLVHFFNFGKIKISFTELRRL
jgi:hypothetical protein